MDVDSLLFDLDGTLWDSCAVCARAWNAVIARSGGLRAPLGAAELAAIMGLPLSEVASRLFPASAVSEATAMTRACIDEEARFILREGGQFYPGVRAGLAALRAHYPLFVVSNCEASYMEAFLEWSGLGATFIDTECHGATGGPKGVNIAAVVLRNGLKAPVYVGDTAGDRQAAFEAGVPFIHASYGFGSSQDSPWVIARFGDLLSMLLPKSAGKEQAPHCGGAQTV